MPLALFAEDKKPKPVDVSKLPLPLPRKVDFTQEVYPLLKESCFSCHGAQKQKGKYRCDTKEGAFKETDYGPTIVAGHSEQSALIHMVAGLVDEMLMHPPSDKPGQSEKLTGEQIGLLRAWIDQGAVWPDGPIAEVVKPVTFATDIQPVFAAACGSCHSGASAKGGFDLSYRRQEVPDLGLRKGVIRHVAYGQMGEESFQVQVRTLPLDEAGQGGRLGDWNPRPAHAGLELEVDPAQ